MSAMRDRSVVFLLAAAVLAALLATLVYRGGRGTESAKPRVVVIFKTGDETNQFWSTVREGVRSAAEDYGLDVSIRSPREEIDIDDQIAIVEQAIRERPAAIVLAASDVDRLVGPVREAKKAGIKVVCVDSFISTEDADAKVGTDNVEAGRRCGEALLRLVPAGSRVAVMSYVKGSSTAIGRERGLEDSVASRLALSQTIYSSSDLRIAYEQAKAILASPRPPAAIAALNQPTAVGAARALAESGKARDVVLVGFDNSLDIVKFLERGVIRDTIVQKPFNMGYIALQTARTLIDGRKAPAYINTGSVDVDRENMFEPANQKLLFPVVTGQ